MIRSLETFISDFLAVWTQPFSSKAVRMFSCFGIRYSATFIDYYLTHGAFIIDS